MTDQHRTHDDPAAKRGRKTRGVTAGRVMAAGAGVAAMFGLAAQMQLAGGEAGAAPAPARRPDPVADARVLRWEHDAFQSHGTDALRFAADERAPIVLTPHTVVNTVGGASGGSGGSAGYSAPSYSAPAAAPVASSGGSAPH